MPIRAQRAQRNPLPEPDSSHFSNFLSGCGCSDERLYTRMMSLPMAVARRPKRVGMSGRPSSDQCKWFRENG